MYAQTNSEDRTVKSELDKIASEYETPRGKGISFESLFREAAPLIPELEVRHIWIWSEWVAARHQEGLNTADGVGDTLTGIDDGIDLVAELNNGTLVAIQCKCYAEDKKIYKHDIEKFITGSKPKIFPLRWLVAVNEYNAIAQGLTQQHDIRTIDFREYLDLRLNKKKSDPPRVPWDLQQEAIDTVISGFAGHDRGRLIMACGTGKTFTALRIVEEMLEQGALVNQNILFIAPSIALVAQSRREWLKHTRHQLACTVICSDKTTGRNQSEDINPTEISCKVTTDPEAIATELKAEIPVDARRVVFCTYQSLKKLQEAQHKYGAPDFAIALVDEAHRTTGYLDEDRAGLFQLIHKADGIKAAKRLYMTATPRIYNLGKSKKEDHANIVDMNDEEYYGKEFYRLTFKKAVEADMLCDYRVIALGITEDTMASGLKSTLMALNDNIGGAGKAADEQAFLALGSIALAINGIVEGENAPGVLARTIVYASNIRRSKWLASALKEPQMKSWITRSGKTQSQEASSARTIHTQHLDGTSSALQRNAALRKLTSADEDTPSIITNARLFTEGIDVPALNAIAFLDPRQSKVDTIQAVGRVMRISEGKMCGYIVVPVILPPGEELLDVLRDKGTSRFKTLGNVLRALQSHDERLYTELTDRLTFATVNVTPPPPRYRPPAV